jgi:hypothetical protein
MDRVRAVAFTARSREIAEWILRRVFSRLLKQAEKIHYV